MVDCHCMHEFLRAFLHVDVCVCVFVCWDLSGVSPSVAPGQAG